MIDPQNTESFVETLLAALCVAAGICFCINFKRRIPRRIFSLLSVLIIVAVCWLAFENSANVKRSVAIQKAVPATQKTRILTAGGNALSADALEFSIVRRERLAASALIFSVACVPAEIPRETLLALAAEIDDGAGNVKKHDSLVVRGNALEFVFSFSPAAFVDAFKKLRIVSPAGTVGFDGNVSETVLENSPEF